LFIRCWPEKKVKESTSTWLTELSAFELAGQSCQTHLLVFKLCQLLQVHVVAETVVTGVATLLVAGLAC
jgi:hypothetical protein